MEPLRQLVDLHRRGVGGVLLTVLAGDAAGCRMLTLNDGRRAGHAIAPREDDAAVAPSKLLQEDAFTADAAALVDAIEASLHGQVRTVVTVLPATGQSLQRFIMDRAFDVVFATESLETEDIVPMRRIARRAAHASLHPLLQTDMFVEILQPLHTEHTVTPNETAGKQ